MVDLNGFDEILDEIMDLESEEMLRDDENLTAPNMAVTSPTNISSKFELTSHCEEEWKTLKDENDAANAAKDKLLECLIHRDDTIENMMSKAKSTQELLESAEKSKYHTLVRLRTVEVRETRYQYEVKAAKMEIERLQSEIALLKDNFEKNMEALLGKHALILCKMETDLKAKTEELRIVNTILSNLTETNQILTVPIEIDTFKLQHNISEILENQSKQLEAKSMLFLNDTGKDNNSMFINILIGINRKVLQLLNERTGPKICSIGNDVVDKNWNVEGYRVNPQHGLSCSLNELEDLKMKQLNNDTNKRHIQTSDRQDEGYIETITNYKTITKNLADENLKRETKLLAFRCEQLNHECCILKNVNAAHEIVHGKLEIDYNILKGKFEVISEQLKGVLSENLNRDVKKLTEESLSDEEDGSTSDDGSSDDGNSVYENNTDDTSDRNFENAIDNDVVIIEDENEIINIDSDTDSDTDENCGVAQNKEQHLNERNIFDNYDDNIPRSTQTNGDNVHIYDKSTNKGSTTRITY